MKKLLGWQFLNGMCVCRNYSTLKDISLFEGTAMDFFMLFSSDRVIDKLIFGILVVKEEIIEIEQTITEGTYF